MPGNQTTAQSQYKQIKINDWTAGIVSQDYSVSKISPSVYKPVPNASPKITSSPLTYGVTGLPNGGLLLGPCVYSTDQILDSPSTNLCVVSGMLVKQGSPFPQIFFVVSGFNSGAQPQPTYDQLYQLHNNLSATLLDTVSGNNANFRFLPATFPFYALISDGTNFVEAIGINANPGPISTSNGVPGIYEYPSSTPFNFLTSTSLDRGGIAIPFGGRVWFFETGIAHPFSTNEMVGISYTDPTTDQTANNSQIGNQQTLIDYECITSFGAWGQIVSGEILLVKFTGGGVIVTGDIFSPNVTKVPAIQSTNGLFGNAPLTPIGLVYRALGNGVWAWNGGAQATKISAQISDSVWIENTGIPDVFVQYEELNFLSPFVGNYYYNMVQIGNFLMTDSGMFYDLNTNAWWRLPPYVQPGAIPNISNTPQVCKFFAQTTSEWATLPPQVNFISIWNDQIANKITQTSWTFDPGQIIDGSFPLPMTPPTDPDDTEAIIFHSFWESNPIVISDNVEVEIQEIIITMQGVGHLTVGVTNSTNSRSVTEGGGNRFLVQASNGFAKIRVTTQLITDVIRLQLGWINDVHNPTTVTPIIESIIINYRQRYPVPVAN